jgi:hypothetical protein
MSVLKALHYWTNLTKLYFFSLQRPVPVAGETGDYPVIPALKLSHIITEKQHYQRAITEKSLTWFYLKAVLLTAYRGRECTPSTSPPVKL